MNRSVSMSFIPQTGVIDLRRNLHHGNSAVYGFSEPGSAHFLDACYLCKRRLGEGCDIYMYRGDTAFCSEECRQQQIAIDDRKEKAEAAAAAMNVRGGVKKGQVAGNSKYRVHAGTVAAG